MYIAFEGIDGCGKTKQLSLLASYLLENSSKAVFVTKELGSSHDSVCQQLRNLFLNDSIDLDDLAGQHILAACSIQHSEKVIKKHLSENTIILSDRSVESNIAYGRAKFGKQIDGIFLSDTRRIYPQVVLFLDIDPELSWSRLMSRRKEEFSNNGTDRIEGRGLEFQKIVRQEYLKRAAEAYEPKDSKEWILGDMWTNVQLAQLPVYLHIDIGSDSIQQVHEKIVRTLKIYGVI